MVGTWPKTIRPAVVAVAGRLIRPAARWRPSPDARSRPARAEEFGSARDDDAQHPEPGMVTCPPHPTMQP